MRRFASVLALALLVAAPALAQKPPAQPQRGQLQQPGEIAPPGWRREVAQTGTIFFHCASNQCREGDVVSYRVQQAGQRWSLDQFRVQQERANESMQRDGSARTVEMSGPRDESHDGLVVYVIDKDLTDSNGRPTGMVSAYLAYESQHLTLVATAQTVGAAADNMAPFREALIAWLRGGGR